MEPRPQLHVSLFDCSFANNSATDGQVAGALYVANVASVRSVVVVVLVAAKILTWPGLISELDLVFNLDLWPWPRSVT